jgi:hypothetical protein
MSLLLVVFRCLWVSCGQKKRKASGGRFLHLQTTVAHRFATPYLAHTTLSKKVWAAQKSPTGGVGLRGYDGSCGHSMRQTRVPKITGCS